MQYVIWLRVSPSTCSYTRVVEADSETQALDIYRSWFSFGGKIKAFNVATVSGRTAIHEMDARFYPEGDILRKQ